jgi:hypothetical protein
MSSRNHAGPTLRRSDVHGSRALRAGVKPADRRGGSFANTDRQREAEKLRNYNTTLRHSYAYAEGDFVKEAIPSVHCSQYH